MQLFTIRCLRSHHSTVLGLTLGGVWFAGVSLGLVAARFYGEAFGELVPIAGAAAQSYLGACMASVLPLILSAFAVFFFHRWGAVLACGARGFLVGFTLGILAAAGGMLLCLLLFFSGISSSPVLLWFLWRRLRLGMTNFAGDGLLCLGCCLGLAAVDTWAVAPFLAAALSY